MERLSTSDRPSLEFSEYDDRLLEHPSAAASSQELEQSPPTRLGGDRSVLAVEEELDEKSTSWNERPTAIESRLNRFSQSD
ncbi:MAG: hypothetical protein HC881_24445 [Leptolyngbyaceae cyanobacterium SL_7_1]|nr:hypothetical protein [Leptolyngbyaceae cyanobacterium SL_7_1]